MSEKPPEKLTPEILNDAVKNAAAFRCITEYQPVGGPGDKVFPPTYMGSVYAVENRLIDGSRVACVLLDSVQSQANRMELALLQAWRDKQISIPVISVDFSNSGLQEIGRNFQITSLDAPHRIADAILRDSVIAGAKPPVSFKDSDYAKRWGSARPHNATELFLLCPTALVFGTWGSPEKPGGLGPKFARAIVSEIVAIDVEFGVKTSSRIDPLGIPSSAAVIYAARDGQWTINLDEAELDKQQKPVLFGSGKSKGKPSAINHGNIPPTVSKFEQVDGARRPLGGGITMAHALQTTVISLSALRRLEFPGDDKNATSQRNAVARAALAALGLCAAALASTDGDLRSRCQLHPVKAAEWEIVGGADSPARFILSPADAPALLQLAVAAAAEAGIPWQKDEIKLQPSAQLVELVRRGQAAAGQGEEADGAEDGD